MKSTSEAAFSPSSRLTKRCRSAFLTAELGGMHAAGAEWLQFFEGDQALRSFGGFENSWTLAEQDLPVAG